MFGGTQDEVLVATLRILKDERAKVSANLREIETHIDATISLIASFNHPALRKTNIRGRRQRPGQLRYQVLKYLSLNGGCSLDQLTLYCKLALSEDTTRLSVYATAYNLVKEGVLEQTAPSYWRIADVRTDSDHHGE